MNVSLPFKELQQRLQRVSHVIIKLGTGTLTPHIEQVQSGYFDQLANEIKKIHTQGKQVILVSSGAVGFGRQIAKKNAIRLSAMASVREKQALASLGQSLLIDRYRHAFEGVGLAVGQVLVAKADLSNRKHYRNLKNTLDQLLFWGCVPVINENDAVAISELKVGDNDTLSANIAGMYPQSLLILLTTTDSFYVQKKPVGYLDKVDAETLSHAGAPAAGGTGGMRTKLIAAQQILLSGQIMSIASGRDPSILQEILSGNPIGTWFFHYASDKGMSNRKRWLIHQKHNNGQITIDAGAEKALRESSASLLLVGVNEAKGNFDKGDVINVVNDKDVIIGRGQSSISRDELREKINMKKSLRGLEVIHRDNFVLIN